MMVDFHTHILPGIDDGSPDVKTSVEMVRQELEQGVDTIFLTPHFVAQRDYPEKFIQRRQQAYETLQKALAEEGLSVSLQLGAEVMCCPGMSRWKQLEQLTMGDSPYILVELPPRPWKKAVFEELEAIYLEHGLVPIVAHIDRYLQIMGNEKMLASLECLPVLLQANASFFTERRNHRLALRWLKQERIQLLGSDCHGSQWRSPCLKEATQVISSRLGEKTVLYLEQLAQAVLQGENLIVNNTVFSK